MSFVHAFHKSFLNHTRTIRRIIYQIPRLSWGWLSSASAFLENFSPFIKKNKVCKKWCHIIIKFHLQGYVEGQITISRIDELVTERFGQCLLKAITNLCEKDWIWFYSSGYIFFVCPHTSMRIFHPLHSCYMILTYAGCVFLYTSQWHHRYARVMLNSL